MVRFSSVYTPTQMRHGATFSARQYPRQAFDNLIDPVLNIDWFEMSGPTFPPHPHAGFSAVTYLFADSPNGFINRDSLGQVQDIRPGGLHWSRASRGMMHEELPVPDAGPVRGLQIFINLPAASQADPAAAFPVPAARVESRSGAGWESRVAVDGTSLGDAPQALPSPVRIEEISLSASATHDVDAPAGWGGILIVLEGSASINEETLAPAQAIGFAADIDERIRIATHPGSTRIAMVSGAQLEQPVFAYGPLMLASPAALGEDRDYAAPDDAKHGTIYFHPGAGGLAAQAEHLFATIIPEAQARTKDLTLGEIAILYPAAYIGDAVQEAADRHGFEIVRTDNKALYPRGSTLMRWLEACAGWCCDGWRTGKPRFSRLLAQGTRLFREAILTVEQRQHFQRQIMGFLWTSRDETLPVHDWLTRLRAELIDGALTSCRTLGDEIEILENFMERVDAGGDRAGVTLGQFSGQGAAADRINLSTLHSAKGREFQMVVLFGMDAGRIPWNNPTPKQLRESQRLFYVGFTRAKSEIHMMYSAEQPSRFVTEVQKRLVAP
jgi:redox-sensitive bicupin YhaK (pirin superfamily)